jgi:hypothetical protein
MAVPSAPATSAPASLRLLLAGSVPPDERLHAAAERAGAAIIDETHVHALGRLGLPLAESDASAARHITRQLLGCASGPRAFLDRAQWIVQRARDARAAAVILWLTREDEALAWQLPAMRAALQGAALPVLALTAASWRADDGALDRIAAFAQGKSS